MKLVDRHACEATEPVIYIGHRVYRKSNDLHRRREAVAKKVNLIVSTLDEESLADVREQLAQLNMERKSLEEQIAASDSKKAMQVINPEEVVDHVLAELADLSVQLPTLPTFAVRKLLATIVGSIVGDMETKAVEIVFTLPSWAVLGEKTGTNALRLVTSSSSPTSYQTQSLGSLELGRSRCEYVHNRTPRCFQCRRIREAA